MLAVGMLSTKRARRKATRSRFDRRKNQERKSQHPSISAGHTLLPEQWHMIKKDSNTCYCKSALEEATGCCKVVKSITIFSDKTWKAFVYDHEVPPSCAALSTFPEKLLPPLIVRLIETFNSSVVCEGNPDNSFVEICKKRGGKIRTNRGHGEEIAHLEKNFESKETIRRVDCEILCNTTRCNACKSFRKTLRSYVARQNNGSSDRTSASSHVPYSRLTSDEKTERLRNVQESRMECRQQLKISKERIASLIEKQSISLSSSDATDMSVIAQDVTPLINDKYPSGSPERIFWEQQLSFHELKDKRQMRWHPLVMRFALNLKYQSTAAYKAVRQSGVIHLPSERTLSDYTHWTVPHTGVQLEFVERFCEFMKDVPLKCCALSMDEMRLKSGLVYNKHTGSLVGFVDLGNKGI